jgi:hypothetical protein
LIHNIIEAFLFIATETGLNHFSVIK